jgi:hypothetical protein
MSASPRRRLVVASVSLLVFALAPITTRAEEYVEVPGTVQVVYGTTLVLVLDEPGPISYVIVNGHLIPVLGPRPTVNVDLGKVPQSDYAFMRPGERVRVIGTVSADRRRLLGTSIIRDTGQQAP